METQTPHTMNRDSRWKGSLKDKHAMEIKIDLPIGFFQ